MSNLKSIFEILQNQKLLKKYVIVFFISLYALLLCTQLIAQLFTVKHFDKITGKIIHKQVEVTSYRPEKRRVANYSLVVDLDNKQSYNIDLPDNDWRIDATLKTGDIITIYSASTVYNILSLDILDGGSRVSQVELKGAVVYSFDYHKHEAWKFIALLTAGILLFSYFLYDCYKNG